MILDEYVTSAPSPQNAIDIFKAEWSSLLPPPLQGGAIPLFADARVAWAATQLGGFAGQRVLELGPLEAGHTFMLQQMGAASITAIEANTRAFLKCLIVKEVLGLQRARFLCGDFVEYLRAGSERFDACLASGVLYHMRNPVELLALLAATTDRVFIWTHYYDHEIISRNSHLKPKFPGATEATVAGYQHRLYRQEYQAALNWQGYCGGAAEHSHWLEKEAIIGALHHFGFTDVRFAFEHPEHPNGPSLALTATKIA
jgi:hypothetical protein